MITSQKTLELVQNILKYWAENDPFTVGHTFINEKGDIEIHTISLCGYCIGELFSKFRHIIVSTSVQFPGHLEVVINL